MQRVSMGSALLGLALVLAAGTASAVIHTGTINGDEAQTTSCTVGSPSRIVGTWTYDDALRILSWSFTYGDNAPAYDDGDLVGTPNSAHFHGPAAPGAIAGARVGIQSTTPNAGSVSVGPFGGEVLAEQWYLDIHTTACGPGELRGQLLLDPPPTVPSISPPIALVLAAGLAGFGSYRLRRRMAARV